MALKDIKVGEIYINLDGHKREILAIGNTTVFARSVEMPTIEYSIKKDHVMEAWSNVPKVATEYVHWYYSVGFGKPVSVISDNIEPPMFMLNNGQYIKTDTVTCEFPE